MNEGDRQNEKRDQFSPLPLINQHRSFGVINNHLKLYKIKAQFVRVVAVYL